MDKIEPKEENIVKKTCKELGITQKELAKRLEVPQTTLSGWVTGDIPKMTEK
ncbi:MAG: helix-turn-helix transcriptional regulator, partial [Campylobacterota bacterium]|nr:helix-turn-helix transcriptional regulator [Campylobacterota bacterium]